MRAQNLRARSAQAIALLAVIRLIGGNGVVQ